MSPRMWLVGALACAVLAAPLPAEAQSAAEGVEASAAPGVGRGYWMLGLDGQVWPFGDAPYLGQPSHLYGGYPDCSPETTGTFGFCDVAIDLEPTPTAEGYWVLDTTGGDLDARRRPRLPARRRRLRRACDRSHRHPDRAGGVGVRRGGLRHRER